VIRSLALVLAVSAARDPEAAFRAHILALEPEVVHDTNRPAHLEPIRSFVYTSDDDALLGAWRMRAALRLTPGVVIDDRHGIWIEGSPLGDGALRIDGVRTLGAPTVFP
jgi:hypothetical protein